jgi:phosphonopyruvate decarboxylase
MLNCAWFYDRLRNHGISFFTGVPDSLLKDFCAYLEDHLPRERHVIAANEGGALALAAGHYLATGSPGLVYMQNSGLGNAVNPLTSLLDPLVYSIPALLLVGWRGEPGTKDEPQHARQGQITLELLETLKVSYALLPREAAEAEELLRRAAVHMKERREPFALVVSKGTFEPYALASNPPSPGTMTREEAVQLILSRLDPSAIVVSTTGGTSREVFEYRAGLKEGHQRDFLTVGSMGHASQIALGIALAQGQRQVYCLDGDGALLMHMGGLAIIGELSPRNFKHILLNNGAHDSVGGQPTAALSLDIPALARACGYRTALQAVTGTEVEAGLDQLKLSPGPALLEIVVKKGARKDLGRPTTSPAENKEAFMQFIAQGPGCRRPRRFGA